MVAPNLIDIIILLSRDIARLQGIGDAGYPAISSAAISRYG
jgi:hypothetical protein